MKIHFLMGNIDIEFTTGKTTFRTITVPSHAVLKMCVDDCSYKPIKIYGTKRKRFRKTPE